MKLKIALVQFARGENFKDNVERMRKILSSIKNVEIVCLPEAWVGKALILKPEDVNHILSSIGEIAKRNRFNIILGGFFTKRENRIISTCHLINGRGEAVGFTDKLFPSTAVGERRFASFGEKLEVFTVNNVKFGVVICVDIMYPEIVRKLALNDAKIIFNPANIPKNRIKLWEHIGITRASENTVYYVFVNNTKTTYPDGRKVMGESFIAAPNGEIVFKADESENVFHVKLDLSTIEKVRGRWPYLSDIKNLKTLNNPSMKNIT